MIWLAVGVGGALGSLARHQVNVLFGHLLQPAVPYATAAVNLTGSLAIGLLAGLIASGRLHMSTEMRTFVFVGILGGSDLRISTHLHAHQIPRRGRAI